LFSLFSLKNIKLIGEPRDLNRIVDRMEDKNHKEIEKLEREIERSLNVVKMKELHKQIEDIERLRKQISIRSINERILLCFDVSKGVMNALLELKEKDTYHVFSQKIPIGNSTLKAVTTIITTYESICFDLQRTLDIKKEDFDKLFPKIDFIPITYDQIPSNLNCLNLRLMDMRNYCLRLL
jgi:hypothetical protein